MRNFGGSKLIKTSGYGTELKRKFDQIAGLIAKKYGNPSGDSDFLSEFSAYSDPRDYMTALVKEERYLSQRWYESERLSLPDDISKIFLIASASETGAGRIIISYHFTNKEDCRK